MRLPHFDGDKVEPRREFIEKHALEVQNYSCTPCGMEYARLKSIYAFAFRQLFAFARSDETTTLSVNRRCASYNRYDR